MQVATNDPVRPIESLLHFVWYGRSLPDFALIAMASALRHNPGSTVWLWHEPELERSQALERLTAQGLRLCRIDLPQLAQQVPQDSDLNTELLLRIYSHLRAPAARSNLLRQLALYVHGGIYLDTDTLTLRCLSQLRSLGGFCGLEHVLWPSHRKKYHAFALALDGLRWVYGRSPGGPALHRQLLGFYSQAANNAVLGFHQGHAFSRDLLQAATRVPEAEWGRRFRFGTHLLQQQLDQAERPPKAHPVAQLSPAYFYPQGPVISLHYFRRVRDVAGAASQLLAPDTHVIHWYASVGHLRSHDARHIQRHQLREVYSHLCAPYLDLFE